MPGPLYFDQTTILLKKVLDIRVQNQQVIASNIANADTPGYAASRLEFEEKLQNAIRQEQSGAAATHPGHIPISASRIEEVRPDVIQEEKSSVGDGNSVSRDQEMIALAENQLLYEAATQMLNKKLGLLKYVVQGGR